MRISLFVFCAAALATSGAVTADENTQEGAPIELSAAQMDQITAGTLQLNKNNNKEIFLYFDNPAPDDVGVNFCEEGGLFCHPALTRRSATAADPINGGGATMGHGPSVDGFGNDGPWAATVGSPVITCVGFDLPPDFLGFGGAGCSP